MRNSVIVLRGGARYAGTRYGTIGSAMQAARAESLRWPEAVVYCSSSDRALRIVQTMRVSEGRIKSLTVRFRGKVVTSDETIPEELWDRFNGLRR